MGYAYAVLAGFASDYMLKALQERDGDCGGSSNSWGNKDGTFWFMEYGREQGDGAITGTVMQTPHPELGGNYCKRIGGVRIEPDGTVTRWPTSSKDMRIVAKVTAKKNYDDIFGKKNTSEVMNVG